MLVGADTQLRWGIAVGAGPVYNDQSPRHAIANTPPAVTCLNQRTSNITHLPKRQDGKEKDDTDTHDIIISIYILFIQTCELELLHTFTRE